MYVNTVNFTELHLVIIGCVGLTSEWDERIIPQDWRPPFAADFPKNKFWTLAAHP